MKAFKLIALMTVVCSFAGVAWAADDANVLRADLYWGFPSGSTTVLGAKVEAQDAFGLDISYERRVTDVVGMQFGAGYTKYDIDANIDGSKTKVATIDAVPVYAGILFHPLARESKVDWYIGAQIIYISYGDLNPEEGGTSLGVADPLTWGARTGVDIKFSKSIALNIDVNYMYASANNALQYYDSETPPNYYTKDLIINPYNLEVGIAWRF